MKETSSHPSKFSPRRFAEFLRRTWMVLALLLLLIGWPIFYGMFIYTPMLRDDILQDAETYPGEEVDLSDVEWLFINSRWGTPRFASLRYRDRESPWRKTLLAVMDIETSRTMVKLDLGGGDPSDIYKVGNRFHAFRTGHPDSPQLRLSKSVGKWLGQMIRPHKQTEFLELDEESGEIVSRRTMPFAFYPVDITEDGGFYSGFSDEPVPDGGIWGAALLNTKTLKGEFIPTEGMTPWFETTGDLLLEGRGEVYRYLREERRLVGPLTMPDSLPDEAVFRTSRRSDNPRVLYIPWTVHAAPKETIIGFGLLEITLDGSAVVKNHVADLTGHLGQAVRDKTKFDFESLVPRLGLYQWMDGFTLVHWNYRNGQAIVEERGSWASILVYIDSEYLVDKQSGTFKRRRMDKYFPSTFLEGEAPQ